MLNEYYIYVLGIMHARALSNLFQHLWYSENTQTHSCRHRNVRANVVYSKWSFEYNADEATNGTNVWRTISYPYEQPGNDECVCWRHVWRCSACCWGFWIPCLAIHIRAICIYMDWYLSLSSGRMRGVFNCKLETMLVMHHRMHFAQSTRKPEGNLLGWPTQHAH